MSAQKVNYEELKPYIPQNGNEENYALLTHYLMMHNTEQKELKRAELINSFEFSEEKLLQAENFFHNKNIPFTVQAEPSFAFIDLFAGIGGFRLGVPLHSRTSRERLRRPYNP